MRLLVDFLADSAILFSVREIKNNEMKNETDNQFRRLALRVQTLRRADMKEWKALQLDMTTAESDRPTWEQFKREASLKRIGKAAEIVVTRRRMPNIL